MNAIKTKLRSDRGASITFALLLFLVCAVISSVVIVAATAVGGRASQMAELDRRYYAVNSAAGLLRDVLEAQTVTVTTGERTESTIEYTEDSQETRITATTTLAPEIYLEDNLNDIDISADTTSLVATAAKNLTGIVTDMAPLSLAVTGSGITDAEGLKVTIVPGSIVDRKLPVKVFNANTARGAYTLELTFRADIVTNNNERATYGPKEPVRVNGAAVAGEYTQKMTEEKTTVSTVRWKMIDIKVSTDAISTTEQGG